MALTSGATAAIALVANGLEWRSDDEILIPSEEFPANVFPWMQLERFGVRVRTVKRDASGRVTAQALVDAIGPKTRLVAASHVAFLNGYRIDIPALSAGCRERGVLCVIDAAQSVGWAALDFPALGCDALAGLSQKFMCSFDGLGFVLMRQDLVRRVAPTAPGRQSVKQADYLDHRLDYHDSAWRFVGGSLPSMQIYALEAAIGFFESFGKEHIEARVLELAQTLRDMLKAEGIRCIGNDWSSTEKSAIVTIPVQDATTAERLARQKVYVSGIGKMVRAGLHAFNNEADLERLVSALVDCGR